MSAMGARPQGEALDPMRRCLVHGTVGTTADLIRFVIGPDGQLVPDIEERLPGRGFWLSARRETVERALRKSLFAKAARGPVAVPADLVDQLEQRLVRRCLELVGLARRSGEAVAGFEKVREWLDQGRVGLLLQASDGAAHGRHKLVRHGAEVPVVALFTGDELGRVSGRVRCVHLAIAPGRLAQSLQREASRLAGFRHRAEMSAQNRTH
jgi:hypothetical protein